MFQVSPQEQNDVKISDLESQQAAPKSHVIVQEYVAENQANSEIKETNFEPKLDSKSQKKRFGINFLKKKIKGQKDNLPD